jgi:hypothetical protein
MVKLVSAAMFALSCALSCACVAAPQVGWYWNPDESGRGFFIESHYGITFIGAYLYDADGRATWVVAGGPNADPYNFTGQLYYKTGGQTLFGNFVPPGDAVIVGDISFHFTDDTHATLTWPGGTVAVERQIYGGTDAEFRIYSGWWWNPAESGSGYSIERQGNKLFLVGFMYDANGQPVWYFSAGSMTTENTYSGPLLQFANGQTMTGPYKPPGTPATVGAVDINFSRLDRATLKFSGPKSAPSAQQAEIAANERTEEITRQFKDQFLPFFNYYGGAITLNLAGTVPFNGFFGVTGSFTLEGREMDWQFNQLADVGEGAQTATYILLHGKFTLTKTIVSTVLDPEEGIITCTATGAGTLPIAYPFTARSSLQVGNNRPYSVNIDVDGDQIPLTGSLVCKGKGGGVIPYTPPPFPTPRLTATGTGTAVGTNSLGIRVGKFPLIVVPIGLGGTVNISGDYEFEGTDDCDTCVPNPNAKTAPM